VPSEEGCSRLIATSVATDIIDFVTGFFPVLDEAARNITDQIQLNTELETMSMDEFHEYRRYYALPASLRAFYFCQVKTGKIIVPRPQLPKVEMK
jgi:hypothetical protein